jgi:hypothetical protein
MLTLTIKASVVRERFRITICSQAFFSDNSLQSQVIVNLLLLRIVLHYPFWQSVK